MRITLKTLQKMAQEGKKIAMLTCYDASFAALLDEAGVEVLLVGDSLGMVLQGHDTTLPVTLRDIVYHTACVARGSKRAFVIADMPFGSFQVSPQEALRNAARADGGRRADGQARGRPADARDGRFLTERGVPVCGHLGLTPQSVHQLGGYRVQGKGETDAAAPAGRCEQLEEAGAGMIVLEAIPAALAARGHRAALAFPPSASAPASDCSGQVLVLHDMLDVYPGKKAKFVRNFMRAAGTIHGAVEPT